MLELLGKLAQIVQHLWCQFPTGVRSYVNLDDGIEELVNLLEHFDTLLLVLLDCL
jgi:hypothetical protein